MRCALILCGLLAMGIGTAANADAAWTISGQQPCIGLTAGWAKPLAELNKLVGPHWQAAPGPVKGQGLVILFIPTCPNSTYAGKSTGPFSGAFVLVPVEENTSAASQTHAIAVLEAAGKASTPIMKLFQSQGISISNARVSLTVHALDTGKRVESMLHFAHGTLTLDAEMQPITQAMNSTDTTAVRVSPPGVLFNGPESSTRFAKGRGEARGTGSTWLTQLELNGNPLFVTLDTDFIWKFTFHSAPHS